MLRPPTEDAAEQDVRVPEGEGAGAPDVDPDDHVAQHDGPQGDQVGHDAPGPAEALRLAREAAEAVVATVEAFLTGGRHPDDSVLSAWAARQADLSRLVSAERERRRLVKVAALVERSGCLDARFHEHRTHERPLGLLTCDEAIATITDWALPTAEVSEYTAMTATDFEHTPDCKNHDDVGFTAEPATTLAGKEYLAAERTVERLRETLQHVPSGHPLRHATSWTELARRHRGVCDSCDGRVERLGILVRLDIDGVKIEKEYGLLVS